MKNLAKVLAAALVAVFLLTNAVYAETIVDRYVGATSPEEWGPWDVIGYDDLYNISNVSVTTDEDSYLFDIYTEFADNVGSSADETGQNGVELGDLFISTNGWKPFGDAPYKEDNASNGETWEYALVIDNHLSATGGKWNLYSVNKDNITMAYHDSGSFRQGQEVLYNAAGQQSLASGSWLLTADYLRFTIASDLFDDNDVLALTGDNYGFHWTMTCGNDVIEGSFKPVPEPATMFLLGSGLVGLGVIKRKKKIAA